MRVFLPNESDSSVGGGWSWINYFKKGMGSLVTDDYSLSTHCLIAGASLCKPEFAEQAKHDGKKLIIRCDNILRHSRNGGKGMARMQRMATVADLVIYQCRWAKDILDDFLGHPKSVIIYNGVDLDIFRPEGDKINFGHHPVYLYASAAKGENKGWDNAWYDYQQQQRIDPNALLLIAGKVSTDIMNNGFDFFQNERYRYLSMLSTPNEMATIMRSSDYFYAVAMNDCYSNTMLEAAMCGATLINTSLTGGTPELINNISEGREFNGIHRMVQEYRNELEGIC